MTDPVLLDTSVAVPLVFAGHEAHPRVVRALRTEPLGLSGHAAFETFSVLTRLPAPARRSPTVVARLLGNNFPHTRFLGPEAAGELLESLRVLDIAGGSVYDALVGACALEHDLDLATRDRRARETYLALGVGVRLIVDDG